MIPTHISSDSGPQEASVFFFCCCLDFNWIKYRKQCYQDQTIMEKMSSSIWRPATQTPDIDIKLSRGTVGGHSAGFFSHLPHTVKVNIIKMMVCIKHNCIILNPMLTVNRNNYNPLLRLYLSCNLCPEVLPYLCAVLHWAVFSYESGSNLLPPYFNLRLPLYVY